MIATLVYLVGSSGLPWNWPLSEVIYRWAELKGGANKQLTSEFTLAV